MSSDVIALLVVLLICFFIFRRLNKPKPLQNIQIQPSATKRKVNYATKQAIESQRVKKQAVPVQSSQVEPATPIEAPESFLNFKLFSLKDMDSRLSAEFEHVLAEFSKPHPMLLKLTQGSFEQKELSELIKSDPDIAAKILTVVNSAQFSLQQPIKDINHAIIFLGVTQVKSIAMQFALHNSVEFELPAQKKAYDKIWAASFLSSQLALLLGKSLGRDNASELSTLCLLLYLGDLVLLTAKPEIAEQYLIQQSFFERIDNIQKATQTNQAVIGYLLAQVWKLPDAISTPMRHQFKPFVSQVKELNFEDEQYKDLMLCYITCRLSDMVIFGGKKNVVSITELNYQLSQNLEFYYLPENIPASQLEMVNEELNANGFKLKAKELIARMKAH